MSACEKAPATRQPWVRLSRGRRGRAGAEAAFVRPRFRSCPIELADRGASVLDVRLHPCQLSLHVPPSPSPFFHFSSRNKTEHLLRPQRCVRGHAAAVERDPPTESPCRPVSCPDSLYYNFKFLSQDWAPTGTPLGGVFLTLCARVCSRVRDTDTRGASSTSSRQRPGSVGGEPSRPCFPKTRRPDGDAASVGPSPQLSWSFQLKITVSLGTEGLVGFPSSDKRRQGDGRALRPSSAGPGGSVARGCASQGRRLARARLGWGWRQTRHSLRAAGLFPGSVLHSEAVSL